MKENDINLEASWKVALQGEFSKPYFGEMSEIIRNEILAGTTIYPPGKLIFNAFDTTPFDEVKVVIIGQDPYHQPGQAMGLSFSVPDGIRIPASLRNIYKELKTDVGMEIPDHGNLTPWALQGVFMLNAMLTVQHGNAGSHRKIGWQSFTDAVIRKLSDERDGLIFMLWGNFAKSKKELIDEMKHHVLEAFHPSPLAGGKFNGCRHFSRTNDLLAKQGMSPIIWSLS
ncbi:MAG: uracil-DNA glycosylase [Bacteroidetes bacterium]|nr:MAG: uracil-DNA glycosylase [Bacteroidota bacterium]